MEIKEILKLLKKKEKDFKGLHLEVTFFTDGYSFIRDMDNRIIKVFYNTKSLIDWLDAKNINLGTRFDANVDEIDVQDYCYVKETKEDKILSNLEAINEKLSYLIK